MGTEKQCFRDDNLIFWGSHVVLACQKLTGICLLHAFPGCFRGIRFSVMTLFIFSVHVARKRDRVSGSRFRQEDTLIPRKGFYLLPINRLNKVLVERACSGWFLFCNSVANNIHGDEEKCLRRKISCKEYTAQICKRIRSFYWIFKIHLW